MCVYIYIYMLYKGDRHGAEGLRLAAVGGAAWVGRSFRLEAPAKQPSYYVCIYIYIYMSIYPSLSLYIYIYIYIYI